MRLTPERLFGREPLARAPSQLKLSADGRYGSFLLPADDDRERLELWLVDIEGGKARRLLAGAEAAAPETSAERAERERRRQFAHGIVAYEWHPNRHEILFPAEGSARLVDVATGSVRTLTPPGTRQTGLRFAPNGDFVSYVRGGDLYTLSVAEGTERRLTTDGGGTVSNGLADFIAQEEMHRFEGHWWSPRERLLAYVRVDESPVPEMHRHEVDADGIRVVPQRYPFAGGPNVEVRLGVMDLESGETTWLDWAVAEDDYLARVAFAPDGALFVQAQARDQRRLTLRRYAYRRWEELLTETSDTWINLHDNLKLLKDGRVLWTSERDGASALYLCSADRPSQGEAKWTMQRLETGLGRVNRVLAATPQEAWVLGWQSDPTSQALYRVGLDGGLASQAAHRLDGGGTGWCEGAVNAIAGVALATRATASGTAALEVLDGEAQMQQSEHSLPRRTLALPPLLLGAQDLAGAASIGRLPIGDEVPLGFSDEEHLCYRLTEPSPCLPGQHYPVVVFVYGGPGVQRVRQEPPPLTVQLFAQAGFGVFELDNRGSGNRSKAFEDVIHGQLGAVEVEDQLAGVAHLRTVDWVDPRRIGIFGHSYGGYMVLMCLAQSHAFAAGAAVAPVTDWTLYDTHYTERYLGTPAANPAGYAASSVLPRVPNIDTPLLLMHGMADDNVLFTHSLKLIKALQDAGKPFELMTYPGAKHALQERSVAIHRYHCILNFFRRTLGNTSPSRP